MKRKEIIEIRKILFELHALQSVWFDDSIHDYGPELASIVTDQGLQAISPIAESTVLSPAVKGELLFMMMEQFTHNMQYGSAVKVYNAFSKVLDTSAMLGFYPSARQLMLCQVVHHARELNFTDNELMDVSPTLQLVKLLTLILQPLRRSNQLLSVTEDIYNKLSQWLSRTDFILSADTIDTIANTLAKLFRQIRRADLINSRQRLSQLENCSDPDTLLGEFVMYMNDHLHTQLIANNEILSSSSLKPILYQEFLQDNLSGLNGLAKRLAKLGVNSVCESHTKPKMTYGTLHYIIDNLPHAKKVNRFLLMVGVGVPQSQCIRFIQKGLEEKLSDGSSLTDQVSNDFIEALATFLSKEAVSLHKRGHNILLDPTLRFNQVHIVLAQYLAGLGYNLNTLLTPLGDEEWTHSIGLMHSEYSLTQQNNYLFCPAASSSSQYPLIIEIDKFEQCYQDNLGEPFYHNNDGQKVRFSDPQLRWILTSQYQRFDTVIKTLIDNVETSPLGALSESTLKQLKSWAKQLHSVKSEDINAHGGAKIIKKQHNKLLKIVNANVADHTLLDSIPFHLDSMEGQFDSFSHMLSRLTIQNRTGIGGCHHQLSNYVMKFCQHAKTVKNFQSQLNNSVLAKHLGWLSEPAPYYLRCINIGDMDGLELSDLTIDYIPDEHRKYTETFDHQAVVSLTHTEAIAGNNKRDEQLATLKTRHSNRLSLV